MNNTKTQLKWIYDDACDNLFFLRTVLILSLTGIGVITTWLPDGPGWLVVKLILLVFSMIPLLWYDRKMENISLEIHGVVRLDGGGIAYPEKGSKI